MQKGSFSNNRFTIVLFKNNRESLASISPCSLCLIIKESTNHSIIYYLMFRYRVCLFCVSFLLLGGLYSCNKEYYEKIELVPNSTILREHLLNSFRSGNSLQTVVKNGDTLCITFSNHLLYYYKCPSVSVINIGLDGFWYQDGYKTQFEYEELSLLENDISRGSSGVLFAVSEGYSSWTFHFVGQDPVVIIKSLFAANYDDKILSINHRGYCTEAPENTLPAYRLSRLKGFNYAETDVRFTADGIPVLLHDAEIDSTSNGHGKVSELKFSQIREYDFGGWKSSEYKGTKIPTLQEFLVLCSSIDLIPVIELKTGNKNQISQIVDMVEQNGLKGRAIYISFSQGLLKTVVEKDPTALVGYLSGEVIDSVIATAKSLRTATNQVVVDANDYSDNAVSKCKTAHLPLWVWTINSEETIRSLSPYINSVTSDNIHAGRLLYGDF